ncbi:hypothetical protein K491DRAFT_749564 [Lophiostoma macrostomum CBS 122681]|uniref:F-box domain-containing protein n=1 Tax=Lophiostoma macrostomum CBS 122681 TaxID=1314788 RepID=A0A6A6TRC8_9PLEO|nr:hypothetical protein K491DRAFT_749564 [Lophiostoma macrostomum CBS 122681]
MSVSVAGRERHAPLHIVELLELILSHLTLGDALYNAQRVSRFWASCIQTSPLLSQKFFLRRNPVVSGTDPLCISFERPSATELDVENASPRLRATMERIRTADKQKGGKGGGNREEEEEPPLRTLSRALCTQTIPPHEYLIALEAFHRALLSQRNAHDDPAPRKLNMQKPKSTHIPLNPNPQWPDFCNQLDTSTLHPLLLTTFSDVEHCMAAYEDHLVVIVGRHGMEEGEGGLASGRDSKAELEKLLRAVGALLNSDINTCRGEKNSEVVQTWRISILTNPAVRKISVTAYAEQIWFRCSYVSDTVTGVTFEKLFSLIAKVAGEVFTWLDPYGDGGRCRGRGCHGRRMPVLSKRSREVLGLIREIKGVLGQDEGEGLGR